MAPDTDPSELLCRGTYLFPSRYFVGELAPNTEAGRDEQRRDLIENGTRIIRRFEILGRRVVITRIGGVFVEVSRPTTGAYRPGEGERIANLLLCDLALRGIASDRVPVHGFSGADVDDERAICTATAGGGGYRRRLAQQHALNEGRALEILLWQHVPERDLDRALENPVAHRLERVHESLPALVLAAYGADDLATPGASGLVDGWMVIEQLLNHLWESIYVPRGLDKQHKKRLRDFRNFTANQRAEVLLAAGIVPPDVYLAVQGARKYRNDLAHSVKLTPTASFETGQAMRNLLGFMLRTRAI